MRCLAMAAPIAMTALPAHAQVAVEGTLQSDYRVRGYSVSDGNPAVSLALCHHPQIRNTRAAIALQAAQLGQARAAYG